MHRTTVTMTNSCHGKRTGMSHPQMRRTTRKMSKSSVTLWSSICHFLTFVLYIKLGNAVFSNQEAGKNAGLNDLFELNTV